MKKLLATYSNKIIINNKNIFISIMKYNYISFEYFKFNYDIHRHILVNVAFYKVANHYENIKIPTHSSLIQIFRMYDPVLNIFFKIMYCHTCAYFDELKTNVIKR